MARYHYKSYRKRPSRRRRQLYYGLTLVAIVAVFLFIRSGNKKQIKETHAGQSQPPSQRQEAPGPAASLFETSRKPEPLPNLLPLPQEGEQNAEAVAFISQAEQDITAGRIVAARDKLNETLRMPLTANQQVAVKKWLSALADKWLFSRDYYPGDTLCSAYEVRPGEILSDIAKRHKIPYQALLEINNISRPEALRAGETIKVVNGPFNAIVYRSAFVMDLYLQSTYVRSFLVGLGGSESPTPTGLWRVKQDGKLIKPSWTDPDTGRLYEGSDPDYPLGSRWIGLEGMQGGAKGRTGFAIHGSKKPEEIGTASSKGCIRLHNGDAILMYNLLTPVYSELKIVE